MAKIFIVEDEEKIREELSVALEKYGYICEKTNNFENVTVQIPASEPDIVLLDINLPVFDGFEITREIRKKSDVPIIVVTSRDSEFDELLMMNLGADDFVTKPYNIQILLSKISAILRRSGKLKTIKKIDCGSFDINIMNNSILNKATRAEVDLTKNEMKILKILVENRGKIVSRDEIMNFLWQSNEFIDDNTLSVNVNRLRKRLEDIGIANVIETRRGMGYIFL
jgi:DNA-binding response OmpR family regulator